MNTAANTNNSPIEPTIKALGQLSPSSQGAVAALVRQLAERDKSFAHKWGKHREEIPDQRKKQGATRGKKAQQSWEPLRQIWCRRS